MSEEEINYFDSYISKEKIREKIKHYEELLQDYIEKYDETNDGIEGMINVLKELLEEGK